MPQHNSLKVLLVDPSLYTAPYDAALTAGLISAGVQPVWAVRPVRGGDRQEIPAQCVDDFFYRASDGAGESRWRSVYKGLDHLVGLARLVGRAFRHRADVVHFQWTVLPLFDAVAIAVLRLFKPVVLTVHDTVPFNGETMSALKRLGFHLPVRLAHRLITHTETGRAQLMAAGVPAAKISVVPHGPLTMPDPVALVRRATDAAPPYNVVLFGEIKPYKGLDVLVEAVGLLPPAAQDRLKVYVSGRPRMELDDIQRRITELGIERCFTLDLRRLSEQDMAELFSAADCFVFPYRQIDASGVYFLVKGLGRWLIASKVGVFAEQLRGTDDGRLVPSGDAAALAGALREAVEEWPQARPMASRDSWESIGAQTRGLYEALLAKTPGVEAPR